MAADFGNIAFVPNSKARYLLRNFERAELVVLVPGGSPFLSGADTLDGVRERVEKSGAFVRLSRAEGPELYVRKELAEELTSSPAPR